MMENQKILQSLSRQFRIDLLRVYKWRRIVRILSIVMYLFVFCWCLFVLFGGYFITYMDLEVERTVTQYIVPLFVGFIALNFLFTRSLAKFQEQENSLMRRSLSALFPSVSCDFTSQLDERILSDSNLFNSSFSDPALGVTTYGCLQLERDGQIFQVADIGVSYGWLNKLELNSVTSYPILLYRYVIRPLFTSRFEGSRHNFRSMFGWCRMEETFQGRVILLPVRPEQKKGYFATNVQGLKRRYNSRLMHTDDREFENYFAVYADKEETACRLLTPAMMRRIIHLREAFGRDMLLSFKKNIFYYAVVMPDGFLCLRKQALDNEHLFEQIYNDISLSFRMADELRRN